MERNCDDDDDECELVAPTAKRGRKRSVEVVLEVPPHLRVSEEQAAKRRKRVGDLFIQNVVMTCAVSPSFDLDRLAFEFYGRKNDRFASCVRIAFNEPDCTVQIFKSRILVLGLCSEEAGQLVITSLLAAVSCMHQRTYEYRNLLVRNILATMHINSEVDQQRLRLCLLRGLFNEESIGALFADMRVPRGRVPQRLLKRTNKRTAMASCAVMERSVSSSSSSSSQTDAVGAAAPAPSETRRVGDVMAEVKGLTMLVYKSGGVVIAGAESKEQMMHAWRQVMDVMVHFCRPEGAGDDS